MASTRLHRTPSSSSNQVKWTWSGWIKKSTNAASGCLFCAFTDVNNYTELDAGSNQIDYYNVTSGAVNARLTTSAYQRDPAAWYHIVVVWDSANGTADDRMKVYINGVEQTAFSARTNPSSSLNSTMNSTAPQEIGARATGGSTFFNGQMAHVHFCDGQAYAASDFGETDSTSGIWVAKTSPSVTYGTNGYFLKFASGASGTDSSGNGNNMTVVGSLTNLKDTPDNNFAILNPLNNENVDCTYSNGNTTVTNTGQWRGFISSLGMWSGKWYTEFKITGTNAQNGIAFGIGKAGDSTSTANMESGNNGYASKYAYGYERWAANANKTNNATTTGGYGTTMAENDIGMIAFDGENGTIWTGVNGTWDNSATSAEIAAGTTTNAMFSSIVVDNPFFFTCSIEGTSVSPYVNWNFGNGYFGTTAISSAGSVSTGDDSQFEYDVPTGFYGLNTNNLGSYS